MPKVRTLPSRVQAQPSRVATMQPGSWRGPAGKSSTARGYSYRWQQYRLRFLAAHPLCVMCQARGRITVATVVDHIIPHKGDQRLFWDRANWQSLCTAHHSSDKQRIEHGGYSGEVGLDGWPMT